MLGRATANEDTTGGGEMAVRSTAQGILADESREKREEIIGLLEQAYWMEIETVMSYIANSVNPDGLRAQEIVESLEEDIPGGARPRAAIRATDQGALRSRPGLARVPRRAELPAAAREANRHCPRHPRRDRGRDRRDRALQRDHRDDRRRRLRHAGHGDRHPSRRGGTPQAL